MISGSCCERSQTSNEPVGKLNSLGTSFDPTATEWADCQFFVLDKMFRTLLEGASKAVNLVMEDEQSIFHEGPVLFDDALFFPTNRLGNEYIQSCMGLSQRLLLSSISLSRLKSWT